MKHIDYKKEIMLIAVMVMGIVLVLLIGKFCHGADYIGEVWQNKHGQGTVEYIVKTGYAVPTEIADEVDEVKKYTFIRKNAQTGKIVKIDTADSLDEIIAYRNQNMANKLNKFNGQGTGSIKERWNNWRTGGTVE